MLQDQLKATTGPNSSSEDRTPRERRVLLNVQAVAEMLNCSPRHVYRLTDSKRMPKPYKLGALCRWDRAAIEAWIAGGCRPPR